MYYVTLLALSFVLGMAGFLLVGYSAGGIAGGLVALFINRIFWAAVNPDRL